MAVLFCDTNCELNYKTAAELGIKVIKMPYTICDNEYFYDLGENYNDKWFFNLIKQGNMPITSALNPEDYKNYFRPYFEVGEEILYVSFSSEMSGTFNYLNMAIKELTEEFPNAKFTRFDTKAISMSAGIAVYEAGKMFKAGKSLTEIVAMLEKLRPRLNATAIVDDLSHLKRGGRITAFQAFFGGLLQLKPIIKLTTEGKLSPFAKAKGRLQSIKELANDVISRIRDVDKYPLAILEADCEEDGAKLKAMLIEALPKAEIFYYKVGPVVGTHCGPGTLAVCFIADERPEPKA